MFTLFVFFLDLLQVAGGLEQNLHVLQKSVDVLFHRVLAGVENVREGAPGLGPRGLLGLGRGLGRGRGRGHGRGRGGGQPRALAARLLARPPAFAHGGAGGQPSSCSSGGFAARPSSGPPGRPGGLERRRRRGEEPARLPEEAGGVQLCVRAGVRVCRSRCGSVCMGD